MKKLITRKNIINVIFAGLLLILLFLPSAKAMVLQGLMGIGFFKPDTNMAKKEPEAGLSGVLFKDASGKVVDLGALKGKVVFLNFWAAWCPPCLAEMPSINKLYEQFKDDKNVVFIFVDADSDLPKAREFMERRKYQLPIYAVASEIPDQLFKGSLPTTVVLDKQGRISYNESGAANYGDNKFIAFMTKLRDTN
ncbi:TlpA family protein disulfide reductase [Pedobacter sp. MR2016-24]|uniref:TlpA family protein disulfide reductase n=1 Tax=Pedobacter sp. MR2016-24 TaxID=2994466 RepID=UPI00224544E6|nr:TlpA disulfide reductase family protein [Pedobacter sp. MR2016-24]MCX2482025.1 TlpA disulfide reductase family protein [Pedobacter sp. MR2016-24]